MDSKVHYEARSLILKEGTPANMLYLVKSGEVLCLKSSKDRLIPVFLAKEGDIIGEGAIIQNAAYTYSAISMTSTELVQVPSSSFQQILEKAPSWLVDLSETMISRLQSTASLIAENRLIHSVIIDEERFSAEVEVEYKKLLS